MAIDYKNIPININNDQQIASFLIVDKNSSTICQPKRNLQRLDPSSFRYIAQVYKGNLAFYDIGFAHIYDMNAWGYVTAFDPNCLINGPVKIIIENRKVRSTSTTMEWGIQQQIKSDFALVQAAAKQEN